MAGMVDTRTTTAIGDMRHSKHFVRKPSDGR
jgi:hypothetical protein